MLNSFVYFFKTLIQKCCVWCFIIFDFVFQNEIKCCKTQVSALIDMCDGKTCVRF